MRFHQSERGRNHFLAACKGAELVPVKYSLRQKESRDETCERGYDHHAQNASAPAQKEIHRHHRGGKNQQTGTEHREQEANKHRRARDEASYPLGLWKPSEES